jgi:cob(I)alamin adenosyltransferase
VSKDDLRLEAYGTLDELNGIIGACRAFNSDRRIDAILAEIQNDLFTLGADLATPAGERQKRVRRVGKADCARLEKHIDHFESGLPPLHNFILPGGSSSAALLHVARTVCRRAERRIVTLSRVEPINEEAIVYTNRLSDLLFVLARTANGLTGISDVTWIP